MTIAFRTLRATGALLVLLLCALPVCAQNRPNALDLRIDAMSPQQLLASPASALVDSDRQGAAGRYVGWRIPGFLLTFAIPIGALAYFWRSGGASALRDRLRRSFRSEFGVRCFFGAILAAIAGFATLIPQFYLYRVERVMGISRQPWPAWALSWLATLAAVMVAVGVMCAIVLWLADRTHQWYLYAMLGIALGAMLYSYATPLLIAPFFNHVESLAPTIASPLYALEVKAGIPNVPIVAADWPRPSPAQGAFVSGLGPSQRIVLSDSLVRSESPGETAFFAARAIEHDVDGDQFRRCLIAVLIIIIAMALAVTIADRVGFRRDDDPVSRLALVGALLGCAYLVAFPIYLSYVRGGEARVDKTAIALTGDRASAVRAMVRRADERIEELCPNTFAMLYFSPAPAIATRIATFNDTPDPCR
ncbi:MAG TPA: M48 family metalloprotease [Verrucomicrobiae bacterium]|jgi:STE24 endopeptidase|nr:M48 family metalloprotease [Verrucomicrobiae bacterium]